MKDIYKTWFFTPGATQIYPNLAVCRRHLFWWAFFVLLGVWRGPMGSKLGDCSSWDMDNAQRYGGWIVGQILACYNLTLTAWDLAGEDFWFVGLFPSFGGYDRAPWDHSWGTLPPGMWMRPDNAMDRLSGKFWVATTWLYQGRGTALASLLKRVFWLEVRPIQPESIVELRRVVEDDKGVIMVETQLKMCTNLQRLTLMLLAVTFSTLSSYPKNADSKLFSTIFECKIHPLLTE